LVGLDGACSNAGSSSGSRYPGCGPSDPTLTPADTELKDAARQSTRNADLAKGDPGGTITGTIK